MAVQDWGGINSRDVMRNLASTAPGVGDDSNAGYVLGSFWIDGAANKVYIAVDVTVGAAVWIEITVTSGGGGGGSSNASMGFSGAVAIVAKGATGFLGIGTGSSSGTRANQSFYMSKAGTISLMYVFVSANASNNAGNMVTIMKNGVVQAVTVSYGAGTTGLLSDTSNSFTVTVGDTIDIEVVNTGTGGGTKNIVVETVAFNFAAS